MTAKAYKMKKLLISALALTASLAVNAAAFDWSIDQATEAENGYKIYAILGDTAATSWANEAALASASIGGTAQGTVKQEGRVYGAMGTANHDSITREKNFYLVIVDADGTKFASSAVYSGTDYVYTPPDGTPGKASFSVAGVAYTTFGTSPVPEPTSGMLVLVGLAGLMLRRKRA